ncbi:MAG: basic amino acid ABC transporter substrate-binding protein [Lachnoclostridium edouardi]|nr:basic amino acid ABC transporter substrate-binding protein [Lachnoclostridium edouardi]MDO4279900.1 basic amino acid ABC transporter substrate-binding protein [Lachnoclostridium edouardi]
MMKKSLAILMAAMMAVTAAGCGSKQEETTAAQTTEAAETGDTTAAPEDAETEAEAEGEETAATGGVLTMGTNAEFPPYEYYEGGDIVGIDVEIMAAVAKEMGMELQVEDMAFDSIIPAISSGKVDVGAAGMTVTEERQASVDFTNTYAKASQMIIVKEGSEIAGPADLEGKVIGVQLGTTGDLYCTDLEETGSTIERYNKGFEAVQALLQDKIDAVVIDGEPAKVFVEQSEGLKILEEAFTEEEYAMAVKKGNTELVDNINAALEKLEADGTLDEIVGKYITAE